MIDHNRNYTLGELESLNIIELGRGKVISKNDIRNNPGSYPIYSSSALNNGKMGEYGSYMFDDERITWSIDGGGKFFYRNHEQYSVTNVSGWVRVVNNDFINTKFLYYLLTDKWSFKEYDYINKAHPSVIKEDYILRIPTLDMQKKIVTILDKFTMLEAELEAELEARTKQYKYYLETLLINKHNFKNIFKLEDLVGKITTGNNKIKSDNGKFPVYGSTGIIGYTEEYKYDQELILIARVGANAGFVQHLQQQKIDVSDNTLIIKPSKNINFRYLYYLLDFSNLNKYAKGGGQPLITAGFLNKLEISIPTIDEQERIVSILDKFSTLVNDIKEGLPAEIELRRKQYEYYRNKLLTFE